VPGLGLREGLPSRLTNSATLDAGRFDNLEDHWQALELERAQLCSLLPRDSEVWVASLQPESKAGLLDNSEDQRLVQELERVQLHSEVLVASQPPELNAGLWVTSRPPESKASLLDNSEDQRPVQELEGVQTCSSLPFD
jgi:hypothetical protein